MTARELHSVSVASALHCSTRGSKGCPRLLPSGSVVSTLICSTLGSACSARKLVSEGNVSTQDCLFLRRFIGSHKAIIVVATPFVVAPLTAIERGLPHSSIAGASFRIKWFLASGTALGQVGVLILQFRDALRFLSGVTFGVHIAT